MATQAEAIAITTLLERTEPDIQEVYLRLKLHLSGDVVMDEQSIKNSMDRLESAAASVHAVNKMAYAELND